MTTTTEKLEFVKRGRKDRYETGERLTWRTRCNRYRVALYKSDYFPLYYRAGVLKNGWQFVNQTRYRTKETAMRGCVQHFKRG